MIAYKILSYLLIYLLIGNIILIRYNNLSMFSLSLNQNINNIVFIFNILLFFIFLSMSIKNYISKVDIAGFTWLIGFPFLLIAMYYAVRKNVGGCCKSFSDFIGYYLLKNDFNNFLNKTKEKKSMLGVKSWFLIILILFMVFSYGILYNKILFITGSFLASIYILYKKIDTIKKIFDFNPTNEYLNLPTSDDFDNNWEKFINSINYEVDGIDIINISENIKTQSGGNKINESLSSMINTISNILFDSVKDKNKVFLFKLLENIQKNIDSEYLIKILDRKYMISKSLWIIIMVVLTRCVYNILHNINKYEKK